jgi:hypothetical protein
MNERALISTRHDRLQWTAQYDAGEDAEDGANASLHAAAEEGKFDIVESLLGLGVDDNVRNASNKTPLVKAVAAGNIDVAQRWTHVIGWSGPHCTSHPCEWVPVNDVFSHADRRRISAVRVRHLAFHHDRFVSWVQARDDGELEGVMRGMLGDS